MSQIDLTSEEIQSLITAIAEDARGIATWSEQKIINTIHCWNLKNDTELGYSVDNMSDEELEQAIVEDLIQVYAWGRAGKNVGGDITHLTRFLTDQQRQRVRECFDSSDMVRSLIVVSDEKKEITLDEAYLQDAMDFCGIWLEGREMLAEGNKYIEGPALNKMR